jgi:hypothetical protein
VPKVPSGLAAAGSKLWADLTREFEFDPHEILLLREACRTVDRLDRLHEEALTASVVVENHKGDRVANPAMVEARQQAQRFAQLLASLRLPAGEEVEGRPQRRGGARGPYGIRGSVA